MSDQLTTLLSQVSTAIDEKTPLRIAGGETKTNWLPSTKAEDSGANMADLAHNHTLSLREHSGVVKYEPTELFITVRAGTTVAEVQHILAEKGQMLASDPPQFASRATIGGTLASNLSAAPRPWAGSIRDQVLGVKLINGRGEHLSFGGQVIKNVAGFDASRLQAGGMGWLGVMTEVSLKVAPKPAHQQTYRYAMHIAAAHSAMQAIAGKALPISGLRWEAGYCWLRLDGAPAVLATLSASLPGDGEWQSVDADAAKTFWGEARETLAQHDCAQTPLWRLSLPASAPLFPAMPSASLAAIDWAGSEHWFTGDHAWASVDQFVRSHGGEANRWDATGKRSSAKPAAYQQLLRALKQQLDPVGIFNPGIDQIWSH